MQETARAFSCCVMGNIFFQDENEADAEEDEVEEEKPKTKYETVS